MMKIYKVTMVKLTYDMGLYNGIEAIGYYLNRETAEKVAAENPATIVNRAAKVEEIEVNEN